MAERGLVKKLKNYEQGSWLFAGTCDECGEDETVRGLWRSHLQKWPRPPFNIAIGDFVAFACLCLQAAGGEQDGDEAQKV